MRRDTEAPLIAPGSDVAPVTHHSREEIVETDTYPPGFEEDDRLRSDFIRQLTLRQLRRDRVSPRNEPADQTVLIPRTLVRFWHDPRDVPPDVRNCLKSWDALRDEGFAFRMFDDASAAAYIAERYGPREVAAFTRCRHPAMRSDYLRMCFVLAEGGLYVDADDVLLGGGWKDVFRDGTLKVQPLCYDLTASGMVSASELRRTDLPTDGRIFYVNNNPIAAPPVIQYCGGRSLARPTACSETSQPPRFSRRPAPGTSLRSWPRTPESRSLGTLLPDFELLLDWEQTAEPCWDLAYRNDDRNWRNMDLH